jgi:hypothetical protein
MLGGFATFAYEVGPFCCVGFGRRDMIVSVLMSNLASSCMIISNRFPFSLDILFMERPTIMLGPRKPKSVREHSAYRTPTCC